MTTKFVVFDMDGTIIDSMPTHARVFGEILSQIASGEAAAFAQIYLNSAGTPLDDQFADALRSAGESATPDRVAQCVADFWRGVTREESLLFPGTAEGLREMKGMGLSLFLFSGCSPQVVEAKLSSAGVLHYFSGVFGTVYGERRRTKDELLMVDIISSSGVESSTFASQGVLIGDAVHDIQIARRWGLRSIGRGCHEVEVAPLLAEGAEAAVCSIIDAVPLLRASSGGLS